MGLMSILLSALAVVCAGIGVLTTPVPKLGLIFAFGAPALAVAGVMLGGSAMSRAKRAGTTSETGRLGAILSAIAFVPSLLVALTCGVCNAFFSSGDLHLQKDFRFGITPGSPDAGGPALPPPQRAPAPDSAGSGGGPGPGGDESAPGSARHRGVAPKRRGGGTEPAREPQPSPAPAEPTPNDTMPPPPLPPGPAR